MGLIASILRALSMLFAEKEKRVQSDKFEKDEYSEKRDSSFAFYTRLQVYNQCIVSPNTQIFQPS